MREFLAKTPDDCSSNFYYKDSNFMTLTKIILSQTLIFTLIWTIHQIFVMLHYLNIKNGI